MEAIESSSLISSAVEVAIQYRKLLVKGFKAGHAEFSKLYAYQHQPKFLVLHFFAGRALGRLCVPLSGLYVS
jgi:hypothetical protein